MNSEYQTPPPPPHPDPHVFCVHTQIFLKMILAFLRSIICANYLGPNILGPRYDQVPRDMDVFCICAQLLLKQRLIICAYEQVPRDMAVFCIRTHLFLEMMTSDPIYWVRDMTKYLETWIYFITSSEFNAYQM